MKRQLGAEITVFLALTVILIFSLLLAVLESARTQAARLHFTIAANASIDSLFSQYHKNLWDEYRLLGLEHYSDRQITDEMQSFFDPYTEADNWFPMKTESMDIRDMHLLTDADGKYFEKEVLDYMKYGIAAAVWDLAEAGEAVKSAKDGAAAAELADRYSECSINVVHLENAIGKIAECLQEQERGYEACKEELQDENGDGFISRAGDTIGSLERLPALIEAYETEADRLQAELEIAKRQTEEQAAEGKLTPETAGILDEDIREFESYIMEAGSRRQEIRDYTTRAEENIRLLEELIEEAEETQESIDEWEPENEEDELDEEELWRPLRRKLQNYDLIRADFASGIKDTETAQKLENIGPRLKGGIMQLVFPKDAKISADRLDLAGSPSQNRTDEAKDEETAIADNLYIGEYMLLMTDYFGRGSYDAGTRQTGTGHMETEYILAGQDTDRDNLAAVINRIVGVRTGLNLVCLYRDNDKKSEAKMLAKTIAGVSGTAPIVPVISFLIMSVWALGQAVCDVRDLLAGHKVPLIHDDESFYLTLSGLMKVAEGLPEPDSSREKGWKYADYLRLFLIVGQNSTTDYRCMDVIQMALRKHQSDFRVDRMICSLEMDIGVCAGHVFVGSGKGAGDQKRYSRSYSMHTVTAYSY